MKEPNGKELLNKLVSLYAEQQGVKIKFQTEYIGEEK